MARTTGVRRLLDTARAPGGKAGADPPAVHRDTGRLVALSDAVFAITITLLVLEIRAPTDYTNLLHGLLDLSVTFLFIGQVWADHHVMFDHRARRQGDPASEHPAPHGRRLPAVRDVRPRRRAA